MHVAVEFTDRIRGQVKFESVSDLVEQMGKDVVAARRIIGSGTNL